VDTGGILATADGGFVICGATDSFSTNGMLAGYFAKCTSDGTVASWKPLLYGLDVQPTVIAAASQGHYAVFSTVYLSQDPTTGYPTDLLLWELDGAGNVVTEREIGGSAAIWPPNNWAKNLYAAGNNRYLVCATSYSDPDSIKVVPNLGGGDVWLLMTELSLPYPWLGITAAVKLSFHVEIGKTYQAQYSADLSTWVDFGSSFTAQTYEISQYVDADGNAKYWRLVALP